MSHLKYQLLCNVNEKDLHIVVLAGAHVLRANWSRVGTGFDTRARSECRSQCFGGCHGTCQGTYRHRGAVKSAAANVSPGEQSSTQGRNQVDISAERPASVNAISTGAVGQTQPSGADGAQRLHDAI